MGRAVILNEPMNPPTGIGGASRSDSDGGTFAQQTMRRLPTQGRSATSLIAATMLAMPWALEAQASSDQARHLADAQHAMAARNFAFDGMVGYGSVEILLSSSGRNERSVQVAQAATGDAGRPREREYDWTETLSCELTVARRDIELLQRLELGRDRAEWLAQDLAAARREVEIQSARAAKAVEEASRLKQAEASGGTESETSLQHERERSARLEQDLAAARRNVETQTALAAKASEEASRLKQTRASSEAETSLQQERERSVRLEQDLAASRRDVETQTTLAAKASEEASRLKQARGSSEAELQTSLQQERERSARLEQDLAASRRDVETQTALAAKASEEASRLKQARGSSEAELQKPLQQERERSGRLEQDLAAARRDVETQTVLAAKASEEASRLRQAGENSEAELQKSLQQERERSGRLEQDLAVARRDVETQTVLAAKASEEASRLKQASESNEAKLQKPLRQERERSAQLEQDLAAARRDVETQTALAAKATEAVMRAKRAAEADAAELTKSIQKERERADALAQGLSMTRSALYAYEARARKLEDETVELKKAAASGAPSLRKSAQEERDRAAGLEQDLGTARRDLETQAASVARASEEAARTRQTAERDLAALRSSLQQERARSEQLERDLALAKQAAPNAGTVGSTARDRAADNAKLVADRTRAAGFRVDAQANSNVNSKEAAVTAGLLARATALLRQGDVGAARIVLERAIEMGSAQASFSLAETYDPLVLAKWGTLGTRGDAVRAQDLYAKADAAGIKEAKARFEALRR
ncbi:hypothetical protein CQ12_10615 [Bradyrhizobium jicamae]|uniref:Uncharacterized protein n=1 Tax=Bradyrhizobium jicamae TaxID=280332 RepID=A0A0R3LTP3_9BRAD|nr:hypothetical protein [Bradyrhizobium jicamae]KRR10494.1 hypothetical protein CQ12_10615 [Bradyrhizobium jicamae]